MNHHWLGAVAYLIWAAGCATGSSVAASDPGPKKSGPTDSSSFDAGPSSSSKDGSGGTPIGSRIEANQIFLFGGRNDLDNTILQLNDTWLSDGKTWRLQKPAHAPSPRYSSFAAANGGVVTLFGGFANVANSGTFVPTTYDETWTYDGEDWIEQHPAHSPTGRFAGAFASWKNGLLIFGGDTQLGVSTGETWFWDGSDWTQLQPAHSPSARAEMCIARLGESLLLFGGASSSASLDDTWIFDGSDWIEQHPAHVPAARIDYGMATIGNAVVLGGGNFGPLIDTTWIWSGSDWSELTPAHAPWDAATYRDQFAMVSTADQVFLFGGISGSATADGYTNDAWTWNGTDWGSLDLGPAPPVRGDHTLLYVP